MGRRREETQPSALLSPAAPHPTVEVRGEAEAPERRDAAGASERRGRAEGVGGSRELGEGRGGRRHARGQVSRGRDFAEEGKGQGSALSRAPALICPPLLTREDGPKGGAPALICPPLLTREDGLKGDAAARERHGVGGPAAGQVAVEEAQGGERGARVRDDEGRAAARELEAQGRRRGEGGQGCGTRSSLGSRAGCRFCSSVCGGLHGRGGKGWQCVAMAECQRYKQQQQT